MERRRLGRGLDALLASTTGPAPTDDSTAAATAEATLVRLEQIDENPQQPRKAFDSDELSGLVESIRSVGILQPLVVRAQGDRYQLVAGERRLRAAQMAGFADVPVRIIDFNDQQVLEAALIENIQRADLNPIEKAQGFHDYLQRYQMKQEDLAKRLGLDRTTIANLVRLLELHPDVQTAVRVGQISASHAKSLLSVVDRERQVALCREIVARGLSVHATENLVKSLRQGSAPATAPTRAASIEKTKHVLAIENELKQKLATHVEIRLRAKDKGQIILGFESNDDFERILEAIRGPAAE